MALYEEKGGQLVPIKGDIPQEAIWAIERADDKSIVEHLTSDFASDNFIYSYPIKGGQVVGIGVDGAKEIARLLGNIEVLPDIRIDKDSDPDYFYATVRARDWRTNVTMLGVGRCCKFIVGENWEPTDRKDESAFVKSVNKGIRNAILAVAPQEAIARIIQGFMEQKKLKKLPPSYGKPASAKAAPARIQAPSTGTTEEDTLKKLRQQVGIEASKAFKSEDERKAWQKEQYNVDSMTQLDEGQLQDMLGKVKEMVQTPIPTDTTATIIPPKPTPEELGFLSVAEQNQMRKELFSYMTRLGLKTDAEKANYAAKKGWGKTTGVTKGTLSSYIEVAFQEVTLVKEAEDISENI